MHDEPHAGVAAYEHRGFAVAVAVDFDGIGARIRFADRTAVRYVDQLAVVGDDRRETFYSAVTEGYARDYGGFFFLRKLCKFL